MKAKEKEKTTIRDRERERDEREQQTPSPPPEKVFYDNRIKRKNVLALNEKVAAIREYEKMPVYKRIGRMFHCSPDQIKRIVQQKSTILKEWEQRTRRSQDAKTLTKVVRVSMLGKAVYDWIRRMMYYKDFIITDGLIQKMALQFKSAMGLQNFFPHQDWCDKFRQTYNISSNDSKKLEIAYAQGHSVQIKDIVKDVLSECTPDVPEISDDEEDEKLESKKDENKNAIVVSSSNSQATTSKASVMNIRNMSQLQPLHQLMALPFQGNRVGVTQKVLVATPLNSAGNARSGAAPMTMTIIPLTTISKSATQQQQQPQQLQQQQEQQNSNVAAVSQANCTVPPPMLEIKKEIKTEPTEVLNIKQECLSDDEQETLNMYDDAKNDEEFIKQPSCTKVNSSSSHNSDSEAMDDDMPLHNLRKIMLKEQPPTSEEPKATKNKKTACSSSVKTAKMPPLPPLTRAPSLVNRTANKRKHVDSTASTLPAIKTCAEARKYLKLLEDFALVRENFRLIGLVTRADEVLRELDGNEDVDID